MILRTFLAAVLLASATLTSYAQGPDPKQMAQRQSEWMKTNLNLDARQLVRVDSLNQVYANRAGELFANGPSPEMRDQMRVLNEEKEKYLKPMLNADQWKTYEARKGELRRRPN